jgi:uncharacterized protein YecA (UPF0149 family)
MNRIIDFFFWLFSFIPAKHKPMLPVIVMQKAADPKDPPKGYEVGYKPKRGHDWNPMLKYPRNEACYCGSGVKAKKCCLLHQTLAVNSEFAEKAAPLVKEVRRK